MPYAFNSMGDGRWNFSGDGVLAFALMKVTIFDCTKFDCTIFFSDLIRWILCLFLFGSLPLRPIIMWKRKGMEDGPHLLLQDHHPHLQDHRLRSRGLHLRLQDLRRHSQGLPLQRVLRYQALLAPAILRFPLLLQDLQVQRFLQNRLFPKPGQLRVTRQPALPPLRSCVQTVKLLMMDLVVPSSASSLLWLL